MAAQLKQSSERTMAQWEAVVRIVQPEIVLRWHREMVRQKWSYLSPNRRGRSKTDPAIEQLALRLADENTRWDILELRGS